MEFKFLQLKVHILPQREIIVKIITINGEYLKKILLQNYRASFNETWHKASLGRGNSDFFKNKDQCPSTIGDKS